MNHINSTPELDFTQREQLALLYRINCNMSLINSVLSTKVSMRSTTFDLNCILLASEEFIDRLNSVLKNGETETDMGCNLADS